MRQHQSVRRSRAISRDTHTHNTHTHGRQRGGGVRRHQAGVMHRQNIMTRGQVTQRRTHTDFYFTGCTHERIHTHGHGMNASIHPSIHASNHPHTLISLSKAQILRSLPLSLSLSLLSLSHSTNNQPATSAGHWLQQQQKRLDPATPPSIPSYTCTTNTHTRYATPHPPLSAPARLTRPYLLMSPAPPRSLTHCWHPLWLWLFFCRHASVVCTSCLS